MSRLDIIVFGATGYTGKLVVRELACLLKGANYSGLKWGVAGRSKERLSEMILAVSKETRWFYFVLISFQQSCLFFGLLYFKLNFSR